MRKEKSLGATKHEDLLRKCPDCGCEEIEHQSEEYYCRKCGLVID